MNINSVLKALVIVGSASTLAACGGGGGGDSSSGGGNGGGTTTQYDITPSVNGTGGTIRPSSVVSVDSGDTYTFTLNSNSGYQIASVSGSCGGSLSNNQYRTNQVYSDCTVIASFEEAIVPEIVFEGGDISNSTTSVSISAGEETSFQLTDGGTGSELSVSGSDGLNVNYASQTLTVSANENAVAGENESIYISATNSSGTAETEIVVEITDSSVDAGFCLVGYCEGQEPKEFKKRQYSNNNPLEDGDETVTAHFQGVYGKPLKFTYSVDDSFGEVESVKVRVSNVSDGQTVGEASVIHDDYFQALSADLSGLGNEDLVRLSMTIENASGDTQTKQYDVYLAMPALSMVILEPLDKGQVVELNKTYTYDLKLKESNVYNFDGAKVVLQGIDGGFMEYDNAYRNAEINIDYEQGESSFDLTITNPNGLLEGDALFNVSALNLGFLFRIQKSDGSFFYEGNNEYNNGNGAYFRSSAYFTLTPEGYDYSSLVEEYLGWYENVKRFSNAELEVDNVLNFWVNVFEVNGYDSLVQKGQLERELENFNKPLVDSTLILRNTLYLKETPTYFPLYGVVNWATIEEARDALDYTFGFITDEVFVGKNEGVRQSNVLESAMFKVNLINQHIQAYNDINGTSYGLLESNIGTDPYLTRYTVQGTGMYSFFVGNEAYGEFDQDTGEFLFDPEYTYLRGSHNEDINSYL